MPLKCRESGTYLYRNVRRGGRVVSEYVASGEVARLIGLVEDFDRREAERQRRERKAERDRIRSEDAEANALSGMILEVVKLALRRAGYHRRKRGVWRKRRMAIQSETPDLVVVPDTQEGRAEVFERAKQGDRSTVPVLLAMFAARPKLVEIFGSPEKWAQDAIIGEASGKDLGVEEGMGRKMAEIRRELAGPKPTAIESMLAHRAALCWLRLNLAEWRDASAEGRTLDQAEFERKRIDSMHRRYLSSLTALAQVRKLDLTAIQVNIDARTSG